MTDLKSLTEQNRSLIERFYAAGARGDIETMMCCLADDVVTYEPPYLPFGGEYRGKEALSAIYAAVAQVADVTQFKIHDIVVDGDRAVTFGGYPLTDTGQFTRFAEETRLVDGKIAEIRVYYHDAQSMVAATESG
ncbi:nuclear transport factor 2 family protein [Mycobacterium sp. 21AC1]|uniref:nuclear transport factor 2 family protein n=1 Tax=[Mycobacterium] appelbergii TaxID=2939269 RepID=UPI00293942D1|nr:nuclear transport factor 2 family protein [Mycobacterium sp. 21AC1]MDV3127870.1 nuclear transport factor 2 family protein [Mycobacterium sp. 21AC1]